MLELKEMNAHSKSIDDVAKILETDIKTGITENQGYYLSI